MEAKARWTRIGVRALGLALAATMALPAQEPADDGARTFVYSAKFVCKDAGAPATDAGRAFAPAVYRTVVNLHNLHARPVKIVVRAVEARRIGNPESGASGRLEKRLAPGQAVFLGCRVIQEMLGGDADAPDRVDGFLTIASPARLDAAAVYTAVNRAPVGLNDGVSLDVERLRPKIVYRDGRVEED